MKRSQAQARRLTLLFAALSVLRPSTAQHADTATHLQPVQYRSHFEPGPGAAASSGSRDGWESFPLAQEAGYDPTLQVETTAGLSAVAREAAPTQDGPLRLGFIRRVHLVAQSAATFHARLRAPFLHGTAKVSITLFRGEHEEHHDLTLNSDTWQDVDSPIDPAADWITAVAVDVAFPNAVRTRPERVLMTDVRVTAFGERVLPLTAPQALWDASRRLSYLQRSLLPGETLTAQVDAKVSQHPHWTLHSPDGHQQATGSGATVQHRFTAQAEPGIWTLRFTTDEATATALVLVRDPKKGLLFDQPPVLSPALLASIRERQGVLQKLVQADAGMNIAHMDSSWLLAGLPSYFALVLQPAELAMLDAVIFRATGDPAARTEAVAILRSLLRWPLWVHPWFPAHGYHSYYPVGIMTKFVVVSEQFLGEALPPEDHHALDMSLMQQAIQPIYDEYVREDRLQFDTSNWIGNTVGGALLAALQSDDPSAAGFALGLFIKDRDHFRAGYTRDGSYGEGVTYHRFDLEMTTLVAEAAKRTLGTSVDDLLANGDRYMRYATYGQSGLLDYGDSHVDLTPSNVFAYLAAQNDSASMTDFYFRYRDAGTAQLLSRILWESRIHPVTKSDAPAEVSSTLFADRGIAVFRGSWAPDSSVIAMRAGKNFNHNHADQGSLFYANHGTLWLGEAGYADYYKDPSYPTFNIQAIGHNVLTVDGNPESQHLPGNAIAGTAPTFTHALIGQRSSLVQADLSSVYDEVTHYTRSVFSAPGGVVVVVDSIQADQPHTFQQLWHPKATVTSIDAPHDRWQMTHQATAVDVQTFSPQPLSLTQQLDPMPLEAYERAEHGLIGRPIRMVLSTDKPTTQTTIVTLIQPANGTTAPVWTHHQGFSELTLGHASLRIQTQENGQEPTLTATSAADVIVLAGQLCIDPQHRGSVATSHPVDMALRQQTADTFELEIHADQATDVTLTGFATSDRGATSFHLPPGRSVLLLRSKLKTSKL